MEQQIKNQRKQSPIKSREIKIDHYILGKTLGEGAFGKVKIARHDMTNVLVAIKIINKEKMKQSKMDKKVKREIRILRYFNHPNIIKLFEVLDTQKYLFVIIEYIDGGELFDILNRKGSLSECEARHFFKQLVNGIEHCHQNLVAHRDIKLENILVNKNKMVKIADFGLSNLMSDGKFLKTSCGSPNYAAPEIVNGERYYGAAVDT